MKKKILFSVIVFALLITAIFNVVWADENKVIMPRSVENPEEINTVDENDGIMLINDDIPVEPINITVDEDAIMNELYFNAKEIAEENFYGFHKEITMDGDIINGNTFLCAETVELNDITINGDVFIAANKLKVSTSANLNGNVFIFASNVNFDGKVAREIYGFGKDIVFGEKATVMYNANIVADHIAVKGTFYRDMNLSVDTLEIKDNSVVLGNLNYISEKEANVAESAVITNINFSKYEQEKKKLIDIIEEKVVDFARYFILVMIVFIAILKYLPSVIEKSKKNLSVSSFGLGILAIILVPILLVALLLIRVFSTLVFAALALFILTLMISNAITNIAISKAISDKKENLKLPIVVALVTLINWILYQIPIVGGILAFIWIATGLGISIRNCFTKKS